MDVLASVLALVFPARCVGCGAAPAALCRACLDAARPAPPADVRPAGVDRWVAVFAYEGAVREALARVKYRNARSALPVLAGALVRRLVPSGPAGAAPIEVDVVTWPPTTAGRRRQRGFDQAEHLARAVGRSLGVPVRCCLARVGGPSQTGRSAGERRRGPAFRAVRPVAGLRVLVVDDVATTGATLAAAARALRAAGARGVAAATVAATPRRSPPSAPAPERYGSVTGGSRASVREPLPDMSRGPTSGRESPWGGAENSRWNATRHPP